jgi:hypothetical protein
LVDADFNTIVSIHFAIDEQLDLRGCTYAEIDLIAVDQIVTINNGIAMAGNIDPRNRRIIGHFEKRSTSLGPVCKALVPITLHTDTTKFFLTK